MIPFLCSHCGRSLNVREEMAGQRVRCPHCQRAVEAPGEPVGTPAVPRADSRASGIDERATLPPSAGQLGRRAAELSTAGGPRAPAPLPPALYDFLAPPQAADEIGRLGPFRVLKVLGAGGMGVVYQAEDPQLNRLVALKAMLPGLAASGSNKERFLREARAAAAIEHDHIVAIYLVDEDRGVPFIAMPLLRGESLEDRLQRERKLPVSEALRIGRETALGLAAAHARGLIHRDIKPANLWLEGDKKRVKVLDFGLARQRGDKANLTQQGAIVGTPAYMAPEQANGRKVDFRCDLFSLGCVLYRMSTGQLPFQGADMVATLIAVTSTQPRSPRQINPQVPPALSRLIMQLLAKAPGDRPASAHEVVEAVEEIEREPAPTAPPTGPAIDERTLPEIHRPRPRRRSKRSPLLWAWLAGASGLAAAALIAVLVVVVLVKQPAPGSQRAVEAAGPRAAADVNRGTAGDPAPKKLAAEKPPPPAPAIDKAPPEVPGRDGESADYAAAAWAFSIRGTVGVEPDDGGKTYSTNSVRTLPKTPFHLTQLLLLNNKRVTDDGLRHVVNLTRLKWVWLSNTNITDAGLEHLAKVPSLQLVDLRRTPVTEEGLRRLRAALPRCNIQH